MIRLVIDNSRTSSPFLNFIASRGVPSYAAHSMLDILRDLSVDLARRGRDQVEIQAEMIKSGQFMVQQLFSNILSGTDIDRLARLLGQEIDRLLELVLPLRAVPQPAEKADPAAHPAEDDIIDVEYEVVDAFELRDDGGESAVLVAQAA